MTRSTRTVRRLPSARTRVATGSTLLRVAAWSMAAIVGGLALRPAGATGLSGSDLGASRRAPQYLRYSNALSLEGSHAPALSDNDSRSFSGIGMIACTAGDTRRTSTAFLVGAFDIAVTVAHTFETVDGQPPECVYNSTDAHGQIRERIPVSYIKSQWDDPAAFGKAETDLAVVRLAEPSRYAQRTMPLGRYSGYAESVILVGFEEAAFPETIKLKKRGHILDADRGANAVARAFAHGMDSRPIAAGAPIIDEQSGVTIGVHTLFEAQSSRQPAMATMNDWLEATLRGELRKPAEHVTPAKAETAPNETH